MRIPAPPKWLEPGLWGLTLAMSVFVLVLTLIMAWGTYDLLRSFQKLHDSLIRLDQRVDRLDNALINELDRQREEIR